MKYMVYVCERLIHISHPRYGMNDEANKKKKKRAKRRGLMRKKKNTNDRLFIA